MGGISQLQITQLKIFVQIYESNPSILHMPELGFLKEWLERMGANIPPSPHKTPKLEPWMETVEPMEPESTLEPESDESDIEFKPDIGCLTDGCDSENYLSGKFDRHGTAGSYPLSLKHKQDDFQEDCESAPKKQKFDTEASSGTGREIDNVLLKEVSDFPLKVTVKQEPLSDDDYPTDNLAQFQSAIKNRSVSESSVRVKQEVDESENSKPQVSSNDADTLQKIGEGNGERITQSSSDKSIKDDLMNIDSNNTDNTNILTRTLASKSVETASSELPRKVAENQEQNENGGLSMDRLSPVTIVVKQELDDDSDDSRADEDKVNLVVAEWTDRQLQEAGTSCAQKEDEEKSTRPSCVSSEDSDLCKKDNQKDGQDTDLNNGPPSGDKQDTLENRQQAIQRVIQSLVHACQCRNTSCQFLSCIKLKRTVAHTKNCHKMTNSSCDICKQFIALCCYHAKHCIDKKCKVPFCLQIKTKICLQRIEQRLKHTQMMIQQTLTMQRTKSSAPAPPPADSVGTQPIPSGKPAGAPQAAAMQVDLEAQKSDQRGSVSNIENSMANPTPSIGMAEMDNIPSVVEDLRIGKPKVGSRKIRLIPGKMQVPQPPTTQLLNGLTGVGIDKQIIHENAMEVNTQQQSLIEVHSSETSSAQGPTASTVSVVTSTSSTTSSMSTLAGNSFDIKTEIETEGKTKNGLTGVGLDKQIKHESAMEVNTQPQSLSEVHSSEKTSAQGPTASTVSVVTSTSSTTSSMSTFAGNSINIKTEIETEDKTDNGLTGVGIGKQIIHENAMDVNTQHQSLSEVHSSETSSAQGPTASTVSFVTSTSSTTSSMSTFAGNSIDIKTEIETEGKTENGLTGEGIDKQIIHENAMDVNTRYQSLSEVHSSETSPAQGPTASTVSFVTSTSSTTSGMSTLAGNSIDIKTEIETEGKTELPQDQQMSQSMPDLPADQGAPSQPQTADLELEKRKLVQKQLALLLLARMYQGQVQNNSVTETPMANPSSSTGMGNIPFFVKDMVIRLPKVGSQNMRQKAGKMQVPQPPTTQMVNGLTGVGIDKQIIHEGAMNVNTQHQSLSEVHSSETSSVLGPTACTASVVTPTTSTTSSMSTFAGNSIDIKPEIETEDKTEEEKESGCLQVPVHQVSQRVANYSGLPVSTCKTLTQASSSSHPKPKKSRQNALESLDRDLIRRTVYKILANGKTIPTAKSIQKALRNSMDFPSGLTYLRKLLKELGFTWRKCGSNRRLLTERPDIVIARINFLLKIKEYRDSGRHIVYTLVHSTHSAQKCWQSDNATLAVPFTHGEHLIVLHAGSSEGFLKGAGLVFKANCSTVDNLLEMIGQNFTKWLNEKLIPNLPKNAVLVVENAPYHNIQREKCPTHYTSKADIQAWLERHNIPFAENMLKPKLLELCKGHKPASKYDLDSTLEQFGHTCLRLPQYHTELNVIEMVLGIIKHQIAASNLTFKLKDAMTLIQEAIDSVTPSEWDSCFRHVREAEERFRKTDIAIEEAFKGFIIEVNKEEGTDITSEDTELTDMELSAKDGMEAESDDTERTDTASENGETQVN